MLQRIEVDGTAPTTSLPIGIEASNDPIQIRNIDGLGPVKSALSSTAYATGRGAYFQGATAPERNIVLTLGLNPNWVDQTVESLRKMLYGYFMPGEWCRLRFFTEEYPDVEIEGICEAVEPNIFSQDPEIQVSIINHLPDFVEIDGQTVDGDITTFVSEDPTEYEIDYTGSVPVGFVLEVHPTDDLPSYTGRLAISNETADQRQIMELDEITVDGAVYVLYGTLENARRILTLNNDGSEFNNLIGQAPVNRDWIQLLPGSNVIRVSADDEGLDFSLLYFGRYGGL